MWIVLAFLSALFAGITSILAKCGIRNTDSTVATAIRTCVVLLMAWGMVCLTGVNPHFTEITGKTWLFLILSGLSTGGSWLFYFKALQLGDVNKVVPIDKSSTVLTILLSILIFGESIHGMKAACIVLIGLGTFLMIEKKQQEEKSKSGNAWLICALLSAVFAALTSILGKIGIEGIDSNLGTAIRTAVVLAMAWGMVLVTGKREALRRVSGRELGFICLSGLATGASWLCYYRALQTGPASVVVPIDKLSILITVGFSGMVFHEKLTKKAAVGLLLITAGTLGMLI